MKKRISASLFVVAALMTTNLVMAVRDVDTEETRRAEVIRRAQEVNEGHHIVRNAIGEPVELKVVYKDAGGKEHTVTGTVAPRTFALVVKDKGACMTSMTINGERKTLIPHKPICYGLFTIRRNQLRVTGDPIARANLAKYDYDVSIDNRVTQGNVEDAQNVLNAS